MSDFLFDARWVRPGMTGVGHFAYNLMRTSAMRRKNCGVLLMAGSPYAADFPGFRIFFTTVDLTAHPATDLYEQFVIPWLCLRHGYRGFVSFEGRVPVLHPGFRTFSFVYDLSSFKIAGSHNRKYSFFLRTHLRLSGLFATRILTISNTVRDEIVRTLKIPPHRTAVVYPAGSRLNLHPATPVAGLDKPFFLAVGITNPRKNLSKVLRGFALARIRHPTLRLAVTGNRAMIEEAIQAGDAAVGEPNPAHRPEVGSLGKGPLNGVANLGYVTESELRALYAESSGLIYASLDEGFGIPLIDALEAGCPVLCSDIPVFREVMGASAIYFDPYSPDSIASAMTACLESPHPLEREVAGRRVLDRFTWENSAASFWKVVERKGG